MNIQPFLTSTMEHTAPRLQVLISTINARFSALEHVTHIRHPDLGYLIVHQHANHQDGADITALKNRFRERPDVIVIESYDSGLSRSRNLCLKHATADIVLLADDDVQYQSHFVESILRVFDSVSCDVATFVTEFGTETRYRRKPYRHNIISILGVSSIETAFRLAPIKTKGIRFDENFGLGSAHPISEEAIFLKDCISNKLNVIYMPEVIASHHHKSSGVDWNNKRIWFSKGAVFRRLYGFAGILFIPVLGLTKWRHYKPYYSLFDFLKCNIESFCRFKPNTIR